MQFVKSLNAFFSKKIKRAEKKPECNEHTRVLVWRYPVGSPGSPIRSRREGEGSASSYHSDAGGEG